MLRMARHVHRETGIDRPVSGGRRGAQLRGQRQDPARRALRAPLDPACRGRRGRRAGRRASSSGIATSKQAARRVDGAATRMRGALPRPRASRQPRSSAFLAGGGRRVRARWSDADLARAAWPDSLADEKVVGWFQGRMEFGPRALGAAQHHRAIARSPRMQAQMNLKIKFRESVPPVRAHRPARARRRRTSSWTWSRRTCCSSRRVREERRMPMPEAPRQLWGIDEAERAPLRHPGGHARGLLGARADGDARARIRATTR